MPKFLKKTLVADEVVNAAYPDPDLFFAGTDGWFWLPPNPPISYVHPDSYGPPTLADQSIGASDEFKNFTTYIFGFRDVTHLTDAQRQNQQFKVQHNAPFFWADQYDDVLNPNELRVQLTNLGLHLRPDLTDAHTIHWHGFRNVIPFYDGEPHGSISVPVGGLFTYVYRPRDPGTYMFHCHVEDVEHVTMGMTSLVFVRPLQNGTSYEYPASSGKVYTKFAYNDGDGSTGYDREFALFLSEIWAQGHWGDAHIQESDWSTFKADFSLLNGRVHPDTMLPNSPIDLTNSTHALTIQTDSNGDLMTNSGLEHLQYNPHSSLITCNAGERVLLRFANLGFREAAMTLAGIKMNVIGRDASPMKGRDGTDTSYLTNTILIGAGESYDVIFEAPPHSTGTPGDPPDVYILYNRRYTQESNLSEGGSGGQRTEVRVYPENSLNPQLYINQHPDDKTGLLA
jgi:hypothetical protein